MKHHPCLGVVLEELYRSFNRRSYVHPDPLEMVYRFEHQVDREIAGLVAAGLAYGHVKQILKSAADVLHRMESRPAAFLQHTDRRALVSAFTGFRHRWTRGEEMAGLLLNVKRVLEEYGSLGACFAAGYRQDSDNVLPALQQFVHRLGGRTDFPNSLLPLPERGSACKRWLMYLRWFVRKDAVDPGGWDAVPAAKLVHPIDTHVQRVAASIGLTQRKQADLRTALEVTDAFRAYVPDDPVRYDFVLSRLGIRPDMDMSAFLRSVGCENP